MCKSPSLLRVCWLQDKRLGHLTKVEGALKALSFHYELKVDEIEVHWRPRFLRTCASVLPTSYLKRILATPYNTKCDLIISAGGATEWPNAVLAKKLKVPNIYFGSNRTCQEKDFWILPRFDKETDRVLSFDISPSKVDSEGATSASREELPQLKGRYWTVLLGGSCKGCLWTEDDWREMTQKLIDEAINADVKLLVTSSPRTGVHAENICKHLLEQSGVLRKCIWFTEQHAGKTPSILALLGAAECVIVTEDSATMVNEAVLAGKPVITVSPSNIKLLKRQEDMLSGLHSKKHIHRLQKGDYSFSLIPKNGWNLVTPDWHSTFGSQLKTKIEQFGNKQ